MMPISRNRYKLLLGITCDVECIYIGFYAFYVAMKEYVSYKQLCHIVSVMQVTFKASHHVIFTKT